MAMLISVYFFAISFFIACAIVLCCNCVGRLYVIFSFVRIGVRAIKFSPWLLLLVCN